MTALMQHRLAALEQANIARFARAGVKRELRAREITLEQALFDPRASGCPIYDLLICRRGIGDTKAKRTLMRLRIRENRRCRELTDREKHQILWELS